MTTNINRTELAGNLGNDPEARYSAAGTLIVTASIAVNSSYKQGEEWKERTDWFRRVAFGEAGEALTRFGKGERIRVVGRLQSSEYTDREGQRRTSVEVVVLRSRRTAIGRSLRQGGTRPVEHRAVFLSVASPPGGANGVILTSRRCLVAHHIAGSPRRATPSWWRPAQIASTCASSMLSSSVLAAEAIRRGRL